MKLVLASGSATRAGMLKNAGVPFTVDAADVDEGAIKIACKNAGRSIEQTALELARAKAKTVTARQPGQLVLGSDQMLICDDRWFDKATSVDDAKAQLRFLSGKPHRLVNAAVMLVDGQEVWKNEAQAVLRMRELSPVFIDEYCAKLGDALLKSVGCYAVEGLGGQLFSEIQGSHFVILGLPLLPLLDELRKQKVIVT